MAKKLISDKFSFERSQSSSPSDQKELRCGGQPCPKCGACRDWHQDRNGMDIVKRDDAHCTRDYIYLHDLVRHPDPEHCNNEYYPLQNLICICRNNH